MFEFFPDLRMIWIFQKLFFAELWKLGVPFFESINRKPLQLFAFGGHVCQQRGFPLQKYFIPGCVGRGLDLDSRVRLAAASGYLGICPLGIEVEKQGFRTAWLTTGQTFQGVGLKLMAFILTFRDTSSHVCRKILRAAESGDLNDWFLNSGWIHDGFLDYR